MQRLATGWVNMTLQKIALSSRRKTQSLVSVRFRGPMRTPSHEKFTTTDDPSVMSTKFDKEVLGPQTSRRKNLSPCLSERLFTQNTCPNRTGGTCVRAL